MTCSSHSHSTLIELTKRSFTRYWWVRVNYIIFFPNLPIFFLRRISKGCILVWVGSYCLFGFCWGTNVYFCTNFRIEKQNWFWFSFLATSPHTVSTMSTSFQKCLIDNGTPVSAFSSWNVQSRENLGIPFLKLIYFSQFFRDCSLINLKRTSFPIFLSSLNLSSVSHIFLLPDFSTPGLTCHLPPFFCPFEVIHS